LLQRCLPQLKQWAHGRLPMAARGRFDTVDLVQDAALDVVARLHVFAPQHVGAMQAYLRRAVINRIRDEMRRVTRRPPHTILPDNHPSDGITPLDVAIRRQKDERYREALGHLTPKDRELIVARIELQWSFTEITQRFGLPTVGAARMAVKRAQQRLADQLGRRFRLVAAARH
jgi:RNA polymerase sigma factor (sigma-70 family)